MLNDEQGAIHHDRIRISDRAMPWSTAVCGGIWISHTVVKCSCLVFVPPYDVASWLQYNKTTVYPAIRVLSTCTVHTDPINTSTLDLH